MNGIFFYVGKQGAGFFKSIILLASGNCLQVTETEAASVTLGHDHVCGFADCAVTFVTMREVVHF